jgi:hypothetical protein
MSDLRIGAFTSAVIVRKKFTRAEDGLQLKNFRCQRTVPRAVHGDSREIDYRK